MAEKKEYRSAVRSRRLIRQAFLELLHEKTFEKITVTDIVKRADINRSTFYAHYPDVIGLVEELRDDAIERSLELVSQTDFREIISDPVPFLQGLTSIGAENMDIFRLLSKSDFFLRQAEYLKDRLLQKAINAVDIPEAIRTSSAFRIQVSFFIGGTLNIYQQWIQGRLDCSMEEISRQMGHLIAGMKDLYPDLL